LRKDIQLKEEYAVDADAKEDIPEWLYDDISCSYEAFLFKHIHMGIRSDAFFFFSR
jgi:hypothetical protein